MRAPSRTTVVAATLAGLLGVGAGWLGTARPWQDELMVTELVDVADTGCRGGMTLEQVGHPPDHAG